MKKAKYVLVTLFFGLTLAAVGFDRASNATPVNQPAPAAGEALRIPASVPALELPAPSPQPAACLKNTCLGTRPCSMCCAGHTCHTLAGCFETGLACSCAAAGPLLPEERRQDRRPPLAEQHRPCPHRS